MKRRLFVVSVFCFLICIMISGLSLARGSQPSAVLAQESCVEDWVRIYDGPPLPGSDMSYKVAMDEAGNVYVTGLSPALGQKNDYLTVKYDSQSGILVWEHRYNGTANGEDIPYDIAIDSVGNVYVTGRSEGSATGYDYVTIKYPSNYSGGDPTSAGGWIKRYETPEIDTAFAIDLDSAGNVYVTGKSADDIATIAYDPAGNELWTAHYDGGAVDVAYDIAVDPAGHVYVTGLSVGIGENSDYATVKYDSSGTQLGVALYNGPGNGTDRALAIDLDSAGNVYVTGSSYGIGTGYSDYATIKYNSNLEPLWEGSSYSHIDAYGAARYDGEAHLRDFPAYNDTSGYKYPSAGIAVDSVGHIYVAGQSDGIGGDPDYATIAYNPDGGLLWEGNPDIDSQGAARYHGEDFDYASGSIALYEELISGDVFLYVTGRSFQSGKGFDYCTVKYSGATGTQMGVVSYNNELVLNSNEVASAVAINIETGYVCVTGSSVGYGTNIDYATLKYDLNLNPFWTNLTYFAARYNGPGGAPSVDQAFGIAVDIEGNACVTGRSGTGTFYDYYTVKYDEDGNELWADRYNGPMDNADMARDIVSDEVGNFYVTGSSFMGDAPGTRYDFYTIKYDKDGGRDWEARYHNTDSIGMDYTPQDLAYGIDVDIAGNVYVTGDTFNVHAVGESPNRDYCTVKYDSDGNELWAAHYDGGPDDGAPWYRGRMTVDLAGNVIVTGYSNGVATGYDAATVKYDANGNEQWVARYNGPGNAYDSGRGVAVDREGNVYVSGPSVGDSVASFDYFIAKYSAEYDGDGFQDPVWVVRYDWGRDIPWHMVSDSAGNLYVTGMSRGATNYDYATVKYDTNGNLVWSARYDGGGTDDRAEVIAVDACGNAYVTGRSRVGGINEWDYLTIKYDSSGNQVCVSRYPRPGVDDPWDIAVDTGGNAYITGGSFRGPNDYVTIKYSADPIAQIVNLTCKVENLVTAGVLNSGNGNALNTKLEAALESLDKGMTQTACNQLQAFINQINAFINSGGLTPAQGQELINAANMIIRQLCG